MGILLNGIVSVLMSLLTALMSQGMLKFAIKQILEYAAGRFERSAAKTESKEDDDLAKRLREFVNELEQAWK